MFLPSLLLRCFLCSEHVCDELLKHWPLCGVFPDFSSRIPKHPSLPPSTTGPQLPACPLRVGVCGGLERVCFRKLLAPVVEACGLFPPLGVLQTLNLREWVTCTWSSKVSSE